MRMKIEIRQSFYSNTRRDQQVVVDYHGKYTTIDRLLEENPKILDAVHSDLADYGSSSGRESTYSSEQILRMLLIKTIEALSFRDLIIRVCDSDFLRWFARIGMKAKVMSFGFIDGAFKRISASSWASINQLLLEKAIQKKQIRGEQLRVDSTVYESNIHYPTDTSLLWDSYRVLARMMRNCNELDLRYSMGNRFHDSKIKKLYTFISTQGGRKSASTKRRVEKCKKLLLQRVSALHKSAVAYVEHAATIPGATQQAESMLSALREKIELVEQVVTQSRRVFSGEKVLASERIFSIFEEHTELLKRGKIQKPVEFGHLVTVAQTKEKFISFYAVEEKSRHDTAYRDELMKDHEKRFGALPEKFTADKNYHISVKDTQEWEEKVEVYSVGKKGKRNEEETVREHTKEFRAMQAFRAGCEGSISVLKRVFGLKRCLYRGFKSFSASLGCLVLCHNLVLLSRL